MTFASMLFGLSVWLFALCALGLFWDSQPALAAWVIQQVTR
jgi:hypothetical protein